MALPRGTRDKADTPKCDFDEDLQKWKTLQLSNVLGQPLSHPEDAVAKAEDGLDRHGNINDMEDDTDADPDKTDFPRSGDKPPRKKPRVGMSQSVARERPSANEMKFLRVPCEARCAKKCTMNISHERRRSIFDAYWSMSRHEQRLWVSSRVSRDLKHRDTTGPGYVSRRSMTYSYHLRADDGASHEVCKTFFIATLGYHPKNDRFIVTAVRSAPRESAVASAARQGSRVPPNKLDFPSEEDDTDADPDKTDFPRSGDKPPRKKPRVGVSQSEARERPSANEMKFPALGVPCETRCAKKCTMNISHERRMSIFDAYWSMSRHEQRLWVSSRVSRDLKHRDTTGPGHVSRRSMTYSYHLIADDGASHEVCKTFFIATLGYHPKNDRFIVTAVRSASMDRRGRHVPSNKLDTGPIKAHIESFKPTVSQHKCEHSPRMRRLPSSVTIRFMYGDFKDKNPGAKCSYETYRKVVGELNISFTKQ